LGILPVFFGVANLAWILEISAGRYGAQGFRCRLWGVKLLRHLLWAAVAIAAALCLAVIAIYRGERINSVWLALAAACSYALAYRFYGKFIAARVMALNDRRALCALARCAHDGARREPECAT
jgi:hypothetical protein